MCFLGRIDIKQTTANLLTIESTSIDEYAGDTAGDSIIVTGSGSASKGETAQQYGQPGLICNPPAGTIGLKLKKGALSIIVGSMNYSIPLPENQGETLLFSTDEDGAVIGKHYLDNLGIHTFNDGEDYAVRYSKLEEKINELTDKLDNHVHPNVIISVSGGSGSPAVGVSGNSGASTTDFTTDITDAKVEEILIP